MRLATRESLVMGYHRYKAFTLAELLVAMGVLGVIATFSIPKILNAQQSAVSTAVAKEAMASVSQAYMTYQLNSSISSNTLADDIRGLFNSTSSFTGQIDDTYDGGAWECGTWGNCIQLHNGAVLAFTQYKFGLMDKNRFVSILVDTDGKRNNVTSLGMDLHYNGRVIPGFMRTFGTDITVEGWSNTPILWGADVKPAWYRD